MRKLYIFLFGFLFFSNINAQDGQFTQVYQNPLYLNPSLIGPDANTIRLGGIYRSQWQAIQAPYTNYGVFADTKIKNFAIGFLANQSKAGDSGYKKSNALFAVGFEKPLNNGYNSLAIGAQIGLNQVAIDPTKLSFDNQYNPEIGFDETLLSDENLTNGTMKMTDINIGVSYHFDLDWDTPAKGEVGLAFYHVNEPEAISPMGETLNFDRKIVLHGRINYALNESFGVEPMAFFARQGSATQLVGGLGFGFNMTDSTGFQLGIASRVKDAIILSTIFNFKKVRLGLSFDYNISKLQSTASMNNAMEISMIYNIPIKIERPNSLDTDGDGIIDRRDDCPEVPGVQRLNGCPEELGEKTIAANGKDYDKDGILDENDLCPYEFGYIQFQGCNDQDADGIWDHVDVCPALPGKVENHGCPVEIPGIDSDNDGVPDRFDKCIYIRGTAEFNGCPDTDGDGVSDLMDNCPYVKGQKVWDGCPGDPQKGTFTNRGKQELSVDVVEFETNEYIIRGDYRKMLDRVAEKLKYGSNYNLVIEGHTDNEGSSTYNFQLSQKRANVVKDFLVARGVAPDAIELFHYGENKPRNSNDTSYGKAKNRRVELILFEVDY